MNFFSPSFIQNDDNNFSQKEMIDTILNLDSNTKSGFSIEFLIRWPINNRPSSNPDVYYTLLVIDKLVEINLISQNNNQFQLEFSILTAPSNFESARSNSFLLDNSWHYLSIICNHPQRSSLFYMDGILVGKSWFDINLIDVSLVETDSMIGIAGNYQKSSLYSSSSTNLWMDSLEIEDLKIYSNYSLFTDELGYYFPIEYQKVSILYLIFF